MAPLGGHQLRTYGKVDFVATLSNLLTNGCYSRFHRQGSPDGRIYYRGYPEAVLKTYGACSSNRPLFTSAYYNIEVGDYVERDEEIATIETDKVRWHTGRIDRH
jgi:hypothetical protein